VIGSPNDRGRAGRCEITVEHVVAALHAAPVATAVHVPQLLPAHYAAVADALAAHCRTLRRVVSMNRNMHTRAAAPALLCAVGVVEFVAVDGANIDELLAVRRQFTALEHFEWGGPVNDAPVEVSVELGGALARLRAVRFFCLHHARLDDGGAASLSAGLSRLRRLRSLDLSNTDAGRHMERIAPALAASCQRLTVLNLARCSLDDGGAEPLAAAIELLPCLQEVYVGLNPQLGSDARRRLMQLGDFMVDG
jgi:hypothetical protein